MNITDVKINKLDNDKTKALVSVTFDNCFVITGLKIMEGSKGLFIAMPSRKLGDGTYKDIAFPITKEFREELTQTIFMKYDEIESQQQNQPDYPEEDPNLPF
jgi:stage V sporulation protein G